MRSRNRYVPRWPISTLYVLLLVAAASACSSDTPRTTTTTSVASTTTPVHHPTGPSKGCNTQRRVTPGTSDATIVSGRTKRSYELIVPAGYDATTPLPLIFALHSLTIDYHVVPASSGLTGSFGEHRYIVVAPSGLLGEGDKPYWNAAPVPDNDDVTFLTELLDHLEATLCVDTAKVFSLGMSNGAQMSSLLACRLDGRIAAIGAISGVEYNAPCPSPPTPVIAFHGDQDRIVPFTGGGLNSVTIADRNLFHGKVPEGTPTPGGVEASMAKWATHNECDPKPAVTQVAADVERQTWKSCRAPTELYVIRAGGHAWPGMCFPGMEATLGHCTNDLDATKAMLTFMLGDT